MLKKFAAILLASLFIASAALAATPIVEDTYSPTVQIHVGKGHGSGTVIYSKEKTYVLTNAHVAGPSAVKAENDSVQFLDIRIVSFKYEALDRVTTTEHLGRIVLINKKMDLALVEVIGAPSLPAARIDLSLVPQLGENVFAIGGGYGHTPFLTAGFLSPTEDIDGYPYFLSTAQIVPGNSGGGLYMNCGDDLTRFCFIGVPSRVFGLDGGRFPITHMGFSIKLSTIVKFFENTDFAFVVGASKKTEEPEDKPEPEDADEAK